MSEDTQIKIAILQTKMDNIQQQMMEGFKQLNEKLDVIAGQKADKWVETFMWIMITAVAGVIAVLIFKIK